jgi:hypothetical protein
MGFISHLFQSLFDVLMEKILCMMHIYLFEYELLLSGRGGKAALGLVDKGPITFVTDHNYFVVTISFATSQGRMRRYFNRTSF